MCVKKRENSKKMARRETCTVYPRAHKTHKSLHLQNPKIPKGGIQKKVSDFHAKVNLSRPDSLLYARRYLCLCRVALSVSKSKRQDFSTILSVRCNLTPSQQSLGRGCCISWSGEPSRTLLFPISAHFLPVTILLVSKGSSMELPQTNREEYLSLSSFSRL